MLGVVTVSKFKPQTRHTYSEQTTNHISKIYHKMSSNASLQAARLAQRQLQSIPHHFSNLLMFHGNKQLAESSLSRAYEFIKKVAV
jgi:acetyl-CoA carboxylase alpha subunit